jgi:hypothetical protein
MLFTGKIVPRLFGLSRYVNLCFGKFGGPLRDRPRTFMEKVLQLLNAFSLPRSDAEETEKLKKYNNGWENVRRRNRERHADVLRREMEL